MGNGEGRRQRGEEVRFTLLRLTGGANRRRASKQRPQPRPRGDIGREREQSGLCGYQNNDDNNKAGVALWLAARL